MPEKYGFKLTPIGKAACDIMHYINDAKSADFYSTLEYVASHPDAAKCLKAIFNVPVSERRDAWDILEMVKLRHHPIEESPAIKDLDNLVMLGALKKSKSMYLPFYSITPAGHDVCVTYQNLLDKAREFENNKTKARGIVLEWLHIASAPKNK